MKLKGYMVLGGAGNPPPLPFVGLSGNHTGARTRGQFVIETDMDSVTVNIPSRDKQVILWSNCDLNEFSQRVAVIDSEPGVNYRAKLLALCDEMPSDFLGMMNNVNTSTHGSLAVLGDVSYFGLYDKVADTSYLVWGQESDLQAIQRLLPLRYLVYRFPQMPVAFLPGEVLCSKWWRWTKGSSSLLHAFNALEMRLNNGPAG